MAACQPLNDNDSEVSSTYEIVEHLSSILPTERLRTWSFSSEEYELNRATCAKPKSRYNHDGLTWRIPCSDPDPILMEYHAPNSTPTPRIISKGLKVHLPSDSEDENIYDLVKSPTLSIRSAEPPLPPPLSSIPSRAEVLLKSGDTADDTPAAQGLRHSISFSAPDNIGSVKDEHSIIEQYETVDCSSSVSSRSELMETDPYDEIDTGSNPCVTIGQSKPRFKIAVQKGKSKSLDDSCNATQQDDMYARIPRKPKWNFPSSDEDEEKFPDTLSKQHILSKKLGNVINRQESVTSEEGERPMIPPKLWEEPGSNNGEEECEPSEERHGSDGSVTLREKHSRDSIVMEYNSLYCTGDNRKGSLAGSDDDAYDTLDRIDSEHSGPPSVDGEKYRSSILSHSSSKTGADYEQTSTCVDMDQLSLDGSGKTPKRIVETHETHEIIPSESNEHDIVERIIETQTITEKLDDHLPLKDYNGEDYSKYLENDDEFVSHIYTLGRTLEKGNASKRKSKPLDFAFVENPFSPPSPVIETMPIEKKTVKQKITTLVKKKKMQEDDGIYAEVTPNVLPENVLSENGDLTDNEYENEEPLATLANNPNALKSRKEGNRDGNAVDSTQPHGQAHNTADLLLYEAIESPEITAKHKKADKKKKKIKSDKKRSLFSGIRKLLRKQRNNSQDSTDTSNSAVVIVEDDYQEFVP